MFENALHEVVEEQCVKRAKSRILNMAKLKRETVYVFISIGKCSNAVIVLLRIEPLGFRQTPATKTHIRVYTELIVVPCIVQVTSKGNHILHRVNLYCTTHNILVCSISDPAWVAFAYPL